MPIITSAAVAVSVSVMRLDDRYDARQHACIHIVFARPQFFDLLRRFLENGDLGVPPQHDPPSRIAWDAAGR
jgi:hypothetical protein